METFISHCGRFRSTIDYIFVPSSLLNKVITSKTTEMLPDNTSDHVPVQLNLYCSHSLETFKKSPEQMPYILISKQKIHWSNFLQENINNKYAKPLLSKPETLKKSDLIHSACIYSCMIMSFAHGTK